MTDFLSPLLWGNNWALSQSALVRRRLNSKYKCYTLNQTLNFMTPLSLLMSSQIFDNHSYSFSSSSFCHYISIYGSIDSQRIGRLHQARDSDSLSRSDQIQILPRGMALLQRSVCFLLLHTRCASQHRFWSSFSQPSAFPFLFPPVFLSLYLYLENIRTFPVFRRMHPQTAIDNQRTTDFKWNHR